MGGLEYFEHTADFMLLFFIESLEKPFKHIIGFFILSSFKIRGITIGISSQVYKLPPTTPA